MPGLARAAAAATAAVVIGANAVAALVALLDPRRKRRSARDSRRFVLKAAAAAGAAGQGIVMPAARLRPDAARAAAMGEVDEIRHATVHLIDGRVASVLRTLRELVAVHHLAFAVGAALADHHLVGSGRDHGRLFDEAARAAAAAARAARAAATHEEDAN